MTAVAMQSFGFGEQLVRAIDRSGVAWFVGNDVCAALELLNPRQAMAKLEEDERDCVQIVDAIGRERETTIVSESGVYALVFTSRKPAAKQFRRWVTGEVLPALRSRGEYRMPVANDDIEPSRTPEMPDEYDAIRTKLALVKEARIVFGLKVARDAWRSLQLLPAVTDRVHEPEEAGFAASVLNDLNRHVLEWMEARCTAIPGHREPTQRLYRDYVGWAQAMGRSADDILSLVGFGRVLTACAIGRMHSSRAYRVGLKLAA